MQEEGQPNEQQVLAALGKVLKRRREACSLSQDELAEKLKGDQSHVSRLESGLRGSFILRLFELASALDLSPTELVASIEKELARESAGPVGSNTEH